MSRLPLRAALTALAFASCTTPARAYEELPMRLPATGPGVRAAATLPSSRLIGAQPRR